MDQSSSGGFRWFAVRVWGFRVQDLGLRVQGLKVFGLEDKNSRVLGVGRALLADFYGVLR